VYATAQPLAVLDGGDVRRHTFVAVEGIAPEFAFDAATIGTIWAGDCEVRSDQDVRYVRCVPDRISTFQVEKDGRILEFAVFPKPFALRAWRIETDAGEHLVFSDGAVLPRDGVVEVHSTGSNVAELSVYPRLSRQPRLRIGEIHAANPVHPSLSAFTVQVPKAPLGEDVHVQRVGRDRLTLDVESLPLSGTLDDVYLDIDYVGDTGMAFVDGRLVDDHFYYGPSWKIGLKRFEAELERKGMYFFFRPMPDHPPYLADLPAEAVPQFDEGEPRVRIGPVRVVPEYKAVLAF